MLVSVSCAFRRQASEMTDGERKKETLASVAEKRKGARDKRPKRRPAAPDNKVNDLNPIVYSTVLDSRLPEFPDIFHLPLTLVLSLLVYVFFVLHLR